MLWNDLRQHLHDLVDNFVNEHEAKEKTNVAPTVVDLGKTPNAYKDTEDPTGSSATVSDAVSEEPTEPAVTNEPAPSTPVVATPQSGPETSATTSATDARVSSLEERVDAMESGIQELLRRSAPEGQTPLPPSGSHE